VIIQLRWRSPGLEFAAGPSPKKGVLLAIFAANRRSRLAQRFRRRILNSYVPGLGGYMRRTKLINRVLRAQEPPRVAVAAVLVPVLRREVHRQKRATGASRSGKAAGPDDAGTLTGAAAPFGRTHLNRARRDFAT